MLETKEVFVVVVGVVAEGKAKGGG